ncbi:MAG: serine--tRNA ligase [Acidimicrobiales bacterium]
MIDVRLIREDRDAVTAALGRRGVSPAQVAQVAGLDAAAREVLQGQETMRARVKELSRQVAEARRAKDDSSAATLTEESRTLGEQEREAAAAVERAQEALREALLMLPNLPADEAPVGGGPDDNLELRRWWPGCEDGAPFPEYAEPQRVPHWDVGASLGILDMERGALLAGSMFPMFRKGGSRLLRALSALSLDRNADAYEEIRPPTLVLTETMTASGHVPRFADDGYHVERDGLWAIPTAEVPLTSMHRGEILSEADLPMRFTAATACFRREAGAAGRDTRGALRTHEFDKVELFAYATAEQAPAIHAEITERAEALVRALELPYRVLDLCTGDLGDASARTFDLEVYSPGCDRWLEVSSVSWYRDYQARRANVRYRPVGGGQPVLCHTLNGSALGWARTWAALIETGHQADGSVRLPGALNPYFGGEAVIRPG